MAWSDLYELLKASGEQDQLAAAQPKLPEECRVYHDGSQVIQVTLGPDWPVTDMNWIAVEPDQLYKISNLTHRIVENNIITVDFTSRRVVQLTKSNAGPFRTIKGMSTVLLEDNEKYEFVQFYNN